MSQEEATCYTIQLTNMPSKSKQAGACWIAVIYGGERIYATDETQTIQASVGEKLVIAGAATVRRATKASDREDISWSGVSVSGNPEDELTVS